MLFYFPFSSKEIYYLLSYNVCYLAGLQDKLVLNRFANILATL